ncbi:MAG: 16S rRNA (cytidine(1402)-2'-O)-methyltransferase [Bacteroidales bacterium]|nr:16S rRNA (cytidine(1402)-2'-O)-methyltransferase [Bacteroidales bacterium]
MSKLYLVPTPVGNLEDMTFRAVNVLKSVDCILAEDTRTSAVLMKHYGITTPLVSHHKFNEHKTSESIADRILGGENFALVTDAGTPGISDPGFLLVRTCVEKGVDVECLPGATAFVPALVNSGLPCERFTFEGFLPQKKGKNKKVQDLAEEERTMIFYESPFRLVKTLELFAQYFGEERQACVSREISKLHEENFRGTLKDCIEHFSQKDVKGEIVIVVEGKNRKVRNAECEEE